MYKTMKHSEILMYLCLFTHNYFDNSKEWAWGYTKKLSLKQNCLVWETRAQWAGSCPSAGSWEAETCCK